MEENRQRCDGSSVTVRQGAAIKLQEGELKKKKKSFLVVYLSGLAQDLEVFQ